MRTFAILSPLCAGAAVMSLCSSAAAQPSGGFGGGDRFAITIDNVAGVVHHRVKVGDGDTDSFTSIGSLASFGPLGSLLTPGSPPLTRLGFHYFASQSVSIGSGFYYNKTDDLGTAIVLAPRIGLCFPVGDSSALWLRGGLTYSRWKFDTFGETTVTNLMPAADALFVLSPVDHFSFTLGAIAEFGVYGKIKHEPVAFGVSLGDSESDLSVSQLGLTFGALTSF